jgi:predicted NBD/HSP70 family sugar kinase
MAEGEIVAEGLTDSTGGRKAHLLGINPSRACVIGLTFSSRGISSAWADLRGEVNDLRIYPFDPAQGKERALETIDRALSDQFEILGDRPEVGPVVQIGVGISGLLDASAGVSNVFPRFEEWVDVPLRDRLMQRFKVPVVMDSHIAAITLAESVFGLCHGYDSALYVQLGPGLGVGIVVGGKIYRGSRLSVGEFGHTSITEDGPICYCGNYGCLESIASDYALVQQAEAAVREGVSTRIPEFVSEAGKITPGAVFRAASEGDRFALNLVDKVGQYLGTGIANLVNLLGPKMLILGGTMAEAGDLLLKPIRRTLRSKALQRMEKDLIIKTSGFGNLEASKGAVTLALYEHFSRSRDHSGSTVAAAETQTSQSLGSQ